MKRPIIEIDEAKCTGCGQCIPNCPEGALQIIDGKVRMISDLFCDGLGACIGHCPEGAIRTVEREAEPYDERQVMENIVKGGENVINAHLTHLREHGQNDYLQQALAYLKEPGITWNPPAAEHEAHHQGPGCGCPGAQTIDMTQKAKPEDSGYAGKLASELRNWPVQLQLINPMAAYFAGADLLISADCVPYAFADFHRRFLKDKVLITFCPKLDPTIPHYIEKLATIFTQHRIRSLTVLHMEVPCCSGVLQIVDQALQKSGKHIPVREYTIAIAGEII